MPLCDPLDRVLIFINEEGLRMLDAADLGAAVTALTDALEPGIDRDWTVSALNSEWSCWKAAEHICDVLFSYAGQLAAAAPSAYVKLWLKADEKAGPADLIEGIRATTGILESVVRNTATDVRGYHPSGIADAEGFAAMGVAELLLHGYDIVAGLGLEFRPPDELCGKVLTRIFPTVDSGPDQWLTLRWATGRAEFPGRAAVTEWEWKPAPRSE